MRKRLSDSNVELAFFRVLKVIAESEREAGLDRLDPIDRSMFYHIALNEGEGVSIMMTDLEKGRAFGTLPTVLSRVARLVEQGWIDKEVNPEDSRSRVVVTSTRARRFFQKVSKVVMAAVSG